MHLLVNFLPHCVLPLLAPQTLSFQNFNRATFTMYYIKKTDANFTLNRVLLMLNANYLLVHCIYYKNITDPPNFFDILPVRRLKKVENHWTRSNLLLFKIMLDCEFKKMGENKTYS